MKKTSYSEEQIVRILREADRDPVGEVASWSCVNSIDRNGFTSLDVVNGSDACRIRQ